MLVGSCRNRSRRNYNMYFLRPDSSGPILSPSRPAQCFTKYKWRDEAAAAGGPAIVATQVVSDFLTAYDDLYMQVSEVTLIVFSYMPLIHGGTCTACFPSIVLPAVPVPVYANMYGISWVLTGHEQARHNVHIQDGLHAA